MNDGTDREWEGRKCKPPDDADPAVWLGQWFPEHYQLAGRESKAAAWAKMMCRQCPIQAACLTFAVRTRQRDGVWGGMSPYEREKIRHVDEQPMYPQVMAG